MSRVGKLPVSIPNGVQVTVADSVVSVKGPKGTLTQKIEDGINISIEGGQVILDRATEQKRHKAQHGLYRALINNMVLGVSTGWKKEQELVGVGYRATNQGQMLDLVLGGAGRKRNQFGRGWSKQRPLRRARSTRHWERTSMGRVWREC